MMTPELLDEIEQHCGNDSDPGITGELDIKWLAEHFYYIPELVSEVRRWQRAQRASQAGIPNYFQRRNTR